MQLLAKFEKKFRKFEVALNPMYRIFSNLYISTVPAGFYCIIYQQELITNLYTRRCWHGNLPMKIH